MSAPESKLDTAMDYLRSYRSRQDRIVLALREIQKRLVHQDVPFALNLINELFGSDLKQALDRVDNQIFALRIAISAIEKTDATRSELNDALSHIEILVPEAFEQTSAS